MTLGNKKKSGIELDLEFTNVLLYYMSRKLVSL